MAEESAPRRPRKGARKPDLGGRVAVAAPALAAGIAVIFAGGVVFACAVIGLGLVGLHELYTLMRRAGPFRLAGFLALGGLVIAALAGGRDQVLLLMVLALPIAFFFALVRHERRNVAWAMAATLFGVVWIGLPMAHAMLLRDLIHGRDLLFDILFATFFGDSVAYFVGRAAGRHPLAPRISPNKTVEGLVAGIVAATLGLAGFSAALGQGWLGFSNALLLGIGVALAAPLETCLSRLSSAISMSKTLADSSARMGASSTV